MGVRWQVAYPFSYRNLEEMMQVRGVKVHYATLQRWVVKHTPQLLGHSATAASCRYQLADGRGACVGQGEIIVPSNVKPGFKSLRAAAITLGGIGVMHILARGNSRA
jgi:hypothetical protein